jgi:hypothetical protein
MAVVAPWHSVRSNVHHNNTECNTGNTMSPSTAALERAVSLCAKSAPGFVSRLIPARGMSFPTTGRSIPRSPHARFAQAFSQADHV